MQTKRSIFWIAAAPTVLLAALAVLAVAGPVGALNTFTPGTVADANQVNANFTAVATEVNDNDGRITTLEAAGRVLAAAHCRAWDNGTVTVPRSFTNLPGSPAITATRTGVGEYIVNFGANVQAAYFQASMGDSESFLIIGPPFPVTLPQGSIHVSNVIQFVPADQNEVYVNTRNSIGLNADSSFFIVVYGQ